MVVETIVGGITTIILAYIGYLQRNNNFQQKELFSQLKEHIIDKERHNF